MSSMTYVSALRPQIRDGIANWLTHAAFDPVTLTAEHKAYIVRIEKLEV